MKAPTTSPTALDGPIPRADELVLRGAPFALGTLSGRRP
jgi:hypothetical protein